MNKEYVLRFAQQLLNIDSPSGFTQKAMQFIEDEAHQLGYATARSEKGNLHIMIEGQNKDKTVGLCAHCDTLGLMVRSIKSNGHLALTNIGGPILPTLDGEYCRIYNREGKVYTGTILSTSPAAHVHLDAATKPRTIDEIEVRIDELVHTKEDVVRLGIQNGDYVCYDPKVIVTDAGFIKSRFLDDKISVAAVMGVLQHLQATNSRPAYDIIIMISSFEEVGHGMAWIPDTIKEVLAVDMGCIGLDLSCTEEDVSICAKDSSGPYDYAMTSKLIALAKAENIAYAVDIYPQYSSDVSAALKGGHNIKGALIGPGVHASHGMERTHYHGVEATMKLILAYMMDVSS